MRELTQIETSTVNGAELSTKTKVVVAVAIMSNPATRAVATLFALGYANAHAQAENGDS